MPSFARNQYSQALAMFFFLVPKVAEKSIRNCLKAVKVGCIGLCLHSVCPTTFFRLVTYAYMDSGLSELAQATRAVDLMKICQRAQHYLQLCHHPADAYTGFISCSNYCRSL